MVKGVAKRKRFKAQKRERRMDKFKERLKGKRKRNQREKIVVREINSIGRNKRIKKPKKVEKPPDEPNLPETEDTQQEKEQDEVVKLDCAKEEEGNL